MGIDLVALVHVFKSLLTTFEIHFLTFVIAMDITTGILKGFKNKKANSTKGLEGVIKHFLVLMLVYICYPYLVLLGAKLIAVAFTYFFIAVYGISFTENWGQLGLPLPRYVKLFFEKLKREAEDFEIATIKIDQSGVKVHTNRADLEQKEVSENV